MQAFVMLVLVVVALVSNGIYSLPAINFTDSAVPNQMLQRLSEAPAQQQQQQLPGQVDSRGRIRHTQIIRKIESHI
jgi:hypothetical protein